MMSLSVFAGGNISGIVHSFPIHMYPLFCLESPDTKRNNPCRREEHSPFFNGHNSEARILINTHKSSHIYQFLPGQPNRTLLNAQRYIQHHLFFEAANINEETTSL